MKDWYIYEFGEQLQVAETLQEVYDFFKLEAGVGDDYNFKDDMFGVIKVLSTHKPKLQHIEVKRTIKLV